MINLTKGIGVTATIQVPPFIWYPYEHYNTDSDVITLSLKEMYIHKYAGEYHQSPLNPFKAVML